MDLGTVKSNLAAGIYDTPEEFVRDVRLIFENCILYNGEASHVSQMCKQVQDAFEKLYNDFQIGFYMKAENQ